MKTQFAGYLAAGKSRRNEVSGGAAESKESQKAKHSAYSILDYYHHRLMSMDDMRPWQEALRDYLIARGHIA